MLALGKNIDRPGQPEPKQKKQWQHFNHNHLQIDASIQGKVFAYYQRHEESPKGVHRCKRYHFASAEILSLFRLGWENPQRVSYTWELRIQYWTIKLQKKNLERIIWEYCSPLV